MSWRVVVVSSNAKVDYKLEYLVVRTVDEVKRVHLSEVGVLMLESTAISLTTYLLCELMRRKIKVIVCDHQRNPCGELVPSCGCHDGSAKIRQQLQWDKGIRESVWTEIVREKLSRQKGHLAHRGLPQARLLGEYIGPAAQLQPVSQNAGERGIFDDAGVGVYQVGPQCHGGQRHYGACAGQ